MQFCSERASVPWLFAWSHRMVFVWIPPKYMLLLLCKFPRPSLSSSHSLVSRLIIAVSFSPMPLLPSPWPDYFETIPSSNGPRFNNMLSTIWNNVSLQRRSLFILAGTNLSYYKPMLLISLLLLYFGSSWWSLQDGREHVVCYASRQLIVCCRTQVRRSSVGTPGCALGMRVFPQVPPWCSFYGWNGSWYANLGSIG